ncbi:hypothetical protein BS78_02G026600 [Paspalum vaginatum]|nr:hypothetical protein BS78_02G026600 [Paspalum vaginatum]
MDSKCLFLMIVCCCCCVPLLVASARHLPAAAAADVPKATALTGADPAAVGVLHTGVHAVGGGVSEEKPGFRPIIHCPLPPFCRRAPAAAATNP